MAIESALAISGAIVSDGVLGADVSSTPASIAALSSPNRVAVRMAWCMCPPVCGPAPQELQWPLGTGAGPHGEARPRLGGGRGGTRWWVEVYEVEPGMPFLALGVAPPHRGAKLSARRRPLPAGACSRLRKGARSASGREMSSGAADRARCSMLPSSGNDLVLGDRAELAEPSRRQPAPGSRASRPPVVALHRLVESAAQLVEVPGHRAEPLVELAPELADRLARSRAICSCRQPYAIARSSAIRVVGLAGITCWLTPNSISDGSCWQAARRRSLPEGTSPRTPAPAGTGSSTPCRRGWSCGRAPGGRGPGAAPRARLVVRPSTASR